MKRQKIAARLAALILGLMLALVIGAGCVSAATTMKTTKKCALRTGPSKSAAKIITIPKGAKVTAGVQEGKYTKVVYKKSSKSYGGWAYTKYLKSKSSSSGSSTKKKTATAIYFRKGPGIEYSAITVIEGGETVTVVGEYGNWYKVKYKGITGYLKKGYFTDETVTREVSTAIYMRTSPNKNATIKTVVPAYGKVTVHSRTSNNWYYVTYKNKTGYIYGGYFTTDSGSGATVRIVKTTIYLRSSINISSTANVIAIVPQGAEVTVLSQYNTKWYIVRYGSKTGYMRGGYFY